MPLISPAAGSTLAPAAPSILEEIVAHNRRRLPAAQRREPLEALHERIRALPPPLNFATALRGEGLGVIAEVKKASPSAGVLRPGLRPISLARAYASGGAAAISVLTEYSYFRGSLGSLARIRAALDAEGQARVPAAPRPPLLRKDFIFDPYQVYQARAYGADALLLIVAILDQETLAKLLILTRSLGMEALVEVHDEGEVDRALGAGARVIGINNRDLRTFGTTLETTRRLRSRIPSDRVVVSESGIRGREDMERLRDWGVDAVLIGEALVTAPSPQAKLQELLA